LWDQTIEPLWKKLESDYQNVEQSEKKWCTRKKYFKPYLEIPKKLYPPTCYKHVPKKYKCVRPFPPNKCSLQNTCNSVKKYYEMCKSEEVNVPYLPSMFSEAIANGDSPFKDIDDVTFSRQVQTHCDCHSSNYATVISVCVSFFGTVLILFLLNKFTNLGSIMSHKSIHIKRHRKHFDEEKAREAYKRIICNNPHYDVIKNNISYEVVQQH
ncbi:variable surface protein, partial [Plasmodium gonderi]